MIHVFADCVLDPYLYTLRRAGQPVQLRPKAFAACLYLVEHRHRVVSRKELCAQIWPGQFVTQATLDGVIRSVRQAVGDSGQAQDIVQTLHGRGYRFVADVEERPPTFAEKEVPRASAVLVPPEASARDDTDVVAGADTSAQAPEAAAVPRQHGETRGDAAPQNGYSADASVPVARRERLTSSLRLQSVLRVAGVVLALAVLTLVISGRWLLWRGMRADEVVPLDKSRIAVLPFLNLSVEEDNTYFTAGMTEELISQLSHIRDLTVIARTSVMRYKGTLKDIATIGRELQVGTILQGSVRKVGNNVRISVELIDVASQGHLWSEDYDRELSGVFEIQRDMATRVAQQLKVQMTAGEKQRIDEPRAGNLEAYTLYLRARSFRNQWTEEGLRKAIAYFEQAIARDPNYALAYAGIADAYLLLPFVAATIRPMEVYPHAMSAVEQALQRGSSLAAVHTTMASAKLWYAWDWDGAESSFKQALDLSPNSAAAHRRYAWYLITMGRLDDAIVVMDQARELNPLSPAIGKNMGQVFYFARQFDRAIAQFRRTIEMDPTFRTAYSGLVYAYLQKGMHAEALGVCQEMLNRWGRDPQSLWDLGYASAVSGKHDQARRVLAELRERAKQIYVNPLASAWILIGLGAKDLAFTLLDQAYTEHDPYLTLLNADPVYDSLRADPRFTTLLKKVGLGQ
jgi:TolB-like protein/DNA-binding winged helix-turn-helix (wHTH) protein/Tfp pilus assembly protein PilF